jgi:hypothetical protein
VIGYHWSSRQRREQIRHYGLRPGMMSLDRAWRPPYFCVGLNAETAWRLSGRLHPEIQGWDLWEVWLGNCRGYEQLYYDDGRVKEVRVYERVWKRDVWFVGSR